MMESMTTKLNELLNALEPGSSLTLTEAQISALQKEHPTWIPARGGDGKLRMSNPMSKPYGVKL